MQPEARSQRVVRRAWRSAQRLGAALDLLWVGPAGREPTAEEREQLDALRRLAFVLGAHLLIESGDDVVGVVRRVVEERGSTYVLMGTPKLRRGIGRSSESLPMRLVHALPGVDVRIVSDRSDRAREDT